MKKVWLKLEYIVSETIEEDSINRYLELDNILVRDVDALYDDNNYILDLLGDIDSSIKL